MAVAKEAADAAKISADALKATERGILIEKIQQPYIKGAFFAEQYPNSPTMRETIGVAGIFVLKNYARTPVTIFNLHAALFIGNDPPEDGPAELLIDKALSEYTIAPQAQTDPIEITKEQPISWEMSNQLVRGTAHIWLIGKVRFVDIFDGTCSRQFVWKYDRGAKRFKLHRSAENRSR
jgi:hypothetical protein